MSVSQSSFGPHATELPLDEILRGRKAGHTAPPAGAAAASDPGPLHQHRDRVVPDLDPAAEHELGMDALGAIAAVRGDVDLADQSVNQACRTARGEGGRPRQA